jgi:hypothetical protein
MQKLKGIELGRYSGVAIAFWCHLSVELLFQVAVRLQTLHRSNLIQIQNRESVLGTRKSGKGRRKLGRKKRRMRAKIRHRKK